ncbi:MAG: hypothetical protein WBC92_19850 [Terracidiphilus sp.]
MNSNGERAAIAHMAESETSVAALRDHLREIVDSEAFKGRHRSAQFLTYVVDHALAGHFDSLKERMIGIEIFGRPPSYDTSEDAIVRVTASDVRKRLSQYYGKYGSASEFRITLHPGTYIPVIAYGPQGKPASSVDEKLHVDAPGAFPGFLRHPDPPSATMPTLHAEAQDPAVPDREFDRTRGATRKWMVFAVLLVLINLSLWAYFAKRSSTVAAAPPSVLPWSVLFSSVRPTHVITSDPDLYSILVLTHGSISVSDYANHRYLPENNTLSAEMKDICIHLLAGDKASNVDAQIAAEIAQLAQTYSRKIDVQGARNLQFSNLKTDDNFIFLGSPASNPWSSVFEGQLDFRFAAAAVPGGGMIRDVHPAAKEQATYVPTARGGATGASFALVAFVANPDQSGQVLLLGGLTREGTQAAGILVTDPARLSAAIRTCGISPAGPIKHFEILLRVNAMAGTPSQFDVIACHVLAG